MNIYNVNLNLLKVFATLMREQNVSVTAKRLQLSQPAISNSLQQLRELFQDELLIRGPKGMVPTQKALLLAPQIDQLLSQLEGVLFHEEGFDYQTSTRLFTLGMTDYAEYVILPALYKQLKQVAPGIALKIVTYHDFSPQDFECGKLELGIGLEKKYAKPLKVERLFKDHPVCVARKEHALFKKPMTLKRYLQAKHLATCIHSDGLARADQALKKIHLERQIQLTLQNFLPAFHILSTSDLVGTFSENVAKLFLKKYNLQYAIPPFVIPDYYIVQLWHRQQNNDAGLLWLRQLVKQVCDKNFLSQ